MASLTEQNISEITLLVEARGVEMKELSYDLVDHICCMIEEEMESGKTYSSALEKCMSSFGKKGIREIQEETTFLLTKNTLKMRKSMHITGITAATLLLLATVFKILHWPGAGVAYVLGVALLCLIFMPLFLTVRVKEKIGRPRLWINIVGTLSAFIICSGILFKIMHWPIANTLMVTGGILILGLYLPLYIFNYYKNKELRTNIVITTVVAIAGATMLFSLVQLRNSSDVQLAINNAQFNIDNDNLNSSSFNSELTSSINVLELDTIEKNALKNSIAKAENLVVYIDNLLVTSVLSLNEKGMSRGDAKAVLSRNYAGLGNANMDLDLVRGSSSQKENLETLLQKVASYEQEIENVLGSSSSFSFNEKNFTSYIKRENKHFPIGIVLQDLSTLKLQVQKSQSILLAYYKGKVS